METQKEPNWGNMKISDVVKAYRAAHKLSLRKFADELNKELINTDVTYGTVFRWEDEEHPYEPDLRLLFECLATYRDWRAEWARDCVLAMWPDLALSKVIVIKLPKS